jgi:quercetin dioxygenase-like cupin family protein
MEYVVLNRSELPTVGGARVYEGRRQGGTNISLIFVDVPPGGGPRLHRHPYKEVFVIHEGQAKFTIGTGSINIAAGEL